MRTNIVIDDKSMRDALRATRLKTNRETVELGLRTLIHLNRQTEIRRFCGKLDWKGDLDAMRTGDECEGCLSGCRRFSGRRLHPTTDSSQATPNRNLALLHRKRATL